jgi:hypothetical protein
VTLRAILARIFRLAAARTLAGLARPRLGAWAGLREALFAGLFVLAGALRAFFRAGAFAALPVSVPRS